MVKRGQFEKKHLDALYEELRRNWKGKTEYEQLLRDLNLGVALFDAGRPISNEIDPRVIALIEKHKPQKQL